MQLDSALADETEAKSNAEVTGDVSPSEEDKKEPADDDETQEPNAQNMLLFDYLSPPSLYSHRSNILFCLLSLIFRRMERISLGLFTLMR
jgi:hypothetical protein